MGFRTRSVSNAPRLARLRTAAAIVASSSLIVFAGLFFASSPAGAQPSAPAGSGVMNVSPTSVIAGTTDNTLDFAFTAPAGGMSDGTVTVTVPNGWSLPQPTVNSNPGFVTSPNAPPGSVLSASGFTLTLQGITCDTGCSFDIFYENVTPASTTFLYPFTTTETTTSSQSAADLQTFPSVGVFPAAPAGTGSMTVSGLQSPPEVLAQSQGNNLDFQFTAPSSGMSDGTVTLTIPNDWTAPQTSSASSPGFVSSPGLPGFAEISASGSVITVNSITCSSPCGFQISYADATAPSGAELSNFTTTEATTDSQTAASLATSPVVPVYEPSAGSGSLTIAGANGEESVIAGSTANDLNFAFSAPPGGMFDGSLTLTTPTGWTLPQKTNSAGPGYVTAPDAPSGSALTVSGPTLTISGITCGNGCSFQIDYSDATAPSTAGLSSFLATDTDTNSLPTQSMANYPIVPVNALSQAGSGLMTLSNPSGGTSFAAGSQNNTLEFTFFGPSSGMSNGSLTVQVPADWTAPQTTSSVNPGYVTASFPAGTVAVSGSGPWTITVSGVDLCSSCTGFISYSGVTAPQDLAAALETFSASEATTSAQTLTPLLSSPIASVYPASSVGAGVLTASPSSVTAGSAGNNLSFVFIGPSSGMYGGVVSITVPSGWTAPQIGNSAGPGYVSTSLAAASLTLPTGSSTVTVNNVNLCPNCQFTISYSDVTAQATVGVAAFTAGEATVAQGAVSALSANPLVDVKPVTAGPGSMTVDPSTASTVEEGSSANTIKFDYSPPGTMNHGTVSLSLPSTGSWSGFTTAAGAGHVSTSGTPGGSNVTVTASTVTIGSITCNPCSSFSLTYSDATVPGTKNQPYVFAAGASATTNTTSALNASPVVSTAADPGSGNVIVTEPVFESMVTPSNGNTIGFKFTAPTSGMSSGSVTFTVPADFGAPQSSDSTGADYVSSPAGTVSTSGQTVTIGGLTLGGDATDLISISNVTAPATVASELEQFTFQEATLSSQTLTDLPSSPILAVYTASQPGAGYAAIVSGPIMTNSAGNNLLLIYTAPSTGLFDGSVSFQVPGTWTSPQTASPAGAGYTSLVIGSSGTLTVSNSSIDVSGLTLCGGCSIEISYADASAPTSNGVYTFDTTEATTSSQVAGPLPDSPVVDVYDPSPAGSGVTTITGPTANIPIVMAGSAGNDFDLFFTAPSSGMSGGSVSYSVSGWSAPQTASSTSAGFVSSTDPGTTLAISGSTITVSGINLCSGCTIELFSYDDVTAPATMGLYSLSPEEATTSSQNLTAATTPALMAVYPSAAAGQGAVDLLTMSTLSQTPGNTLAFFIATPASGMSDGTIKLTVPSGWTAPTTTSGNAGFVSADQFLPAGATVSTSGSTITIAGINCAGACDFDLIYSDATAPQTPDLYEFQASEATTSSETLTALPDSPFITNYTAGPAGSGVMTSNPSFAVMGSTDNALDFTFTAPNGGMSGGTVTIQVPGDWSAPQTTDSSQPGFVSDPAPSGSALSVSGSTITLSGITCGPGCNFDILYGNAAAPATAETSTFTVQEATTSTQAPATISSSPEVTVGAATTTSTTTTSTTTTTTTTTTVPPPTTTTAPTSSTTSTTSTTTTTIPTTTTTTLPPHNLPPPPIEAGYRLGASDGGVFAFGAPFWGSAGGLRLAQPVVGMADAASGSGYYLVARDGGVFAYGPGANFYGSTGGLRLAAPIVAMAVDPATGGYWLVGADGGVFSFNAPFFGSTGGLRLNAPIIGIVAAPDGDGYYLIARDGGVFTFGPGAAFQGSTGGIKLAKPIVGMAIDPVTGGYWLVASDGGVFSFNAQYFGSLGGVPLDQPVVGMAFDPETGGYWLVAADGGVFVFHAAFLGSTGGLRLAAPIIGMVAG